MFTHYFKTAWRNLSKYKSFSIINLIGLTLGLSSIMVLAFMLYQFITTNGQFENKDRMFYLKTKTLEGNVYPQTTYPLLDEILKSCPQVEAGTHIQQFYEPWLKYGNKEFQPNTSFVDSGFFKVFSFPLKYGNAINLLNDKHNIVLSDEVADKLFGKENPIGKTIMADDTLPLTVTAVMQKIPTNTTFRPEVLLSTSLLKTNSDFIQTANWYNDFAETYLLLKPNADKVLLNKQIAQIVQTNYVKDAKQRKIQLVPYKDFIQNESGNLTQIMIKGQTGMIVFILSILIINLINLNTATMYNRAKEVAVKKMIGSRKRQIVFQFCIENGLIVFASLILSFILFYFLLLPQINKIVTSSFGALLPNMQHDYPLGIIFIIGAMIIAVAVGAYPAFKLNSLKVTEVVKGKLFQSNKKNYARNIFITIQFTLSIICIGITIILSAQMRQMKSAALGFDKENVLVMPLDLSYKNFSADSARFDALLNTLRANPYVHGISTSNSIPTLYWDQADEYFDPADSKPIHIRKFSVDAGMIPTYKIQMTDGKNFDNTPYKNQEDDIIINETAAKTFGWKSAIGKQIREGSVDGHAARIIGVVKDFHYADLTQNVEPLIIYYNGQQNLYAQYLSIRIDPNHSKEIETLLQNEFSKMTPRRPFIYEFLDSKIDNQYSLLNGILKATSFVSILLIIISAMGLFGLVSLFTKQRVKEIGIRKVFGASVTDIVKMLSQNYVRLIAIASLIALPLIYLIMNKWLQDFAYRISISWWMLITAALIAMIIALSIVVYQSLKAARANPVKSLKTE